MRVTRVDFGRKLGGDRYGRWPASRSRRTSSACWATQRSVFGANPEAFAEAERVEMFRARYSVVPEARGAPPTSNVLLASFPIAQVRETALLRRRATP